MPRTRALRLTVTSIVALLPAAAILAAGCAAETGTTTSQIPSSNGTTTTSAAPPTTLPAGVPSTVSSLPSDTGLTLEQVRNAEITVEFDEAMLTFTLVDGSYQSGQAGSDSTRVEVSASDVVAFGDLDGDAVDDAAMTVRVGKAGAAGASQYVVALLSRGREPVQGGYHLVGVGARVDALAIVDGEIAVEATVPGPEDPAGDATVPITATLRLPLQADVTRILLHTSQTTETPSGDIREITITSPEPGAYVAGVGQIKGTITIAPFENNLVYHVYDTEMTERAMGPLQVDAPDLGAPGTFELVLDLIELGCTDEIFVTISDLSAADGSILAMDSIGLTVLAPT